MGVVWEAWDELLLRRVAVKQLLPQPEMTADEVNLARQRVIREARITARLHHPHAVTLYDVVDHDGYPSLIMQFVPSVSLSALLRDNGVLNAGDVAALGGQVASALAAAHQVGIVHRDVKPGNVLVTADGSAKLTDFGISHAVGDITLTAAGMVSGTPAFLAPEVARGAPSGTPADVFSLGATLYACLEGQPPFGTDPNPMAVLHRAASGLVTPPRRSGPMTALLLQMMALDPADRPTMIDITGILERGPTAIGDVMPPPTSAAETVRHTVEQVHATIPASGPPDTAASTPVRDDTPKRRRRARALIAVLAVAMAAGILTASVLLLDRGADGAAVTDAPGTSPGSAMTAATAAAAAPPTPSTARESSDPAAPSTAPPPATRSAEEPPTRSPTESTQAEAPSGAPEPTPTEVAPAAPDDGSETPPPPQPGPTASELTAAITDYYALMPGNTDQGWSQLTSRFQTGIARNPDYYKTFWGGVLWVDVTDATAEPPDTVEATITYHFTDGTVSVERTAFTLVRDGASLKIDNSAVLSSRTA